MTAVVEVIRWPDELELQRIRAVPDRELDGALLPGRTLGALRIPGGATICATLEDPVRATKIKARTAIPAGRYRVVINNSPRFKRDLPLLIGVRNFVGVRIHAGNDPNDTEGCILVGTHVDENTLNLVNSRAALEDFLRRFPPKGLWLNVRDIPR